MAAKEPEKKIPSTAAKAITRSPKLAVLELIHFSAQSAFFFTHGTAENGKSSMVLYTPLEGILTDYKGLYHMSSMVIGNVKKGQVTYLFQQR